MHGRGDIPFDFLVLTASNEGQAEAYRAELGARGAGLAGRSIVVPDPGGRRVGSGIATLLAITGVLDELRRRGKRGETIPELLAGERVLVVHCGGDSRRLPAYAAHGKIFAPLPIPGDDAQPRALFDLILSDVARIRLPDSGRVLVATGDVYLDVGGQDLGLQRPGVVGVAWASTLDRGSRHGVYVCDGAGRVTGFVHKPTLEQARGAGALRPNGTVLVDTGVVSLDAEAVERWLSAAGVGPLGEIGPGILADVIAGDRLCLDLYGDILPAMAHRERLAGIDWRGDLQFGAAIVAACAFLHIGSSRELLDVLTAPEGGAAGFARSVRARVPAHLPAGVCVHNSVLEEAPTVLGDRVVVEGSHLVRAPALPGGNIVVGVPREVADPVELPVGVGLVCLPLREGPDRWVGLCFGEGDDFKTSLEGGGTFLGEPLAEFLRRTGLDASDLWPGPDERSLWTAALWTPTTRGALFEPIGWMLRGGRAPGGWSARGRLSAAQVMGTVDHAAVLGARGRVVARV